MIYEIRKLIKKEPENIETYITFYNKHRTFNLRYCYGDFSFSIEIHNNDEGFPSRYKLNHNGNNIELNTFEYLLLRGPVLRLCYKNEEDQKREYHYKNVVKPKKQLLEYINNSVYSVRFRPSKQFNECIDGICFHIKNQTGLLEGRKASTESGGGIYSRVEFSSAGDKIIINHTVRVHGYDDEVSLQFNQKYIHLTNTEQEKIKNAINKYFHMKEKQKQEEALHEQHKEKLNFKEKLKKMYRSV